jgi:DNA topoisomerase-1
MGKKLVIVESPAKSKTINKILGSEYIVKSSMGHIRDLPLKNIGVDIKHGFKPKYVLVPTRKKVIDDLRKAADGCDVIYLAPDPDREGEAIAWHLQEVLQSKDKPKEFFRVQYNEITPRAVRQAFEHAGTLDMNRVYAQQARRVLDRIVGYIVSPMLWRNLGKGLSAGRVQSVALRLVCEREAEIRKFVPEEYWILGAMLRKLVAPLAAFKVRLTRINNEKADIKNSEQAQSVKSDLDGRSMKVVEIATREIKKSPYPPYITSTLQQAASSYCGYSPKRTMSIAQKLYEGVDLGEGPVGLITYMRTDSFTIAQDALATCREFITKNFGDDFCPPKPNYYKSRASAQEAHEAIRPTDVTRTPDSIAHRLDPTELKVYKLIWQRFVASQMVQARIEQRTAKIEALPKPGQTNTYIFQATASDVKFPGYMKVSGEDAMLKKEKDGEDAEEEVPLPALSEGESLECVEWLADRKETQPPARYSEASLIRALESNGVGRPSTYAQTISTLHQRNYVVLNNKSIVPTDIGIQVNDLLVLTLGELFNVNFTASMEESLDEIEKGNVEWSNMLKDFYEKFDGWMSKIKRPAADRAAVERLVAHLEKITQWGPETKRGKRTYSDKKFLESIQKQLGDAEKPISPKQLQALARIAVQYKAQITDIEAVLTEAGCVDIFNEPEPLPPSPATMRKLELLKTVTMSESARKFVDSIGARAGTGRHLTAPQIGALNSIVGAHSSQIPDFERIKVELELIDLNATEDDESRILVAALVNFKDWKPPVTRGKRIFDDSAFYASLSRQFEQKRVLSVRQKAALKKMIDRYARQAVTAGNVAASPQAPKTEG